MSDVFSDWMDTTKFLRATLIDDWPNKKLTCITCGETRSVKYSFKGNNYCNACITSAKKDENV